MQLLSCPQARFQGSVRVGQERFAISDASGMLCHYWGGRLPVRWCWVSASNLVGGGRGGGGDRAALPAVGPAPPQLDTGYLFVTQGDRTRMLVSPLTALMRLRGSWHDFQLHTCPLAGGETIRLDCSAAPEQYNDLGEGIRQTLLGTCRVDGASAVSGSAGQKSEATEFPATPPQALWRLTHPDPKIHDEQAGGSTGAAQRSRVQAVGCAPTQAAGWRVTL
jgi:hypothetical protein